MSAFSAFLNVSLLCFPSHFASRFSVFLPSLLAPLQRPSLTLRWYALHPLACAIPLTLFIDQEGVDASMADLKLEEYDNEPGPSMSNWIGDTLPFYKNNSEDPYMQKPKKAEAASAVGSLPLIFFFRADC